LGNLRDRQRNLYLVPDLNKPLKKGISVIITKVGSCSGN
jgi:hypothetical protein